MKQYSMLPVLLVCVRICFGMDEQTHTSFTMDDLNNASSENRDSGFSSLVLRPDQMHQNLKNQEQEQAQDNSQANIEKWEKDLWTWVFDHKHPGMRGMKPRPGLRGAVDFFTSTSGSINMQEAKKGASIVRRASIRMQAEAKGATDPELKKSLELKAHEAQELLVLLEKMCGQDVADVTTSWWKKMFTYLLPGYYPKQNFHASRLFKIKTCINTAMFWPLANKLLFAVAQKTRCAKLRYTVWGVRVAGLAVGAGVSLAINKFFQKKN